MSEAAENFEQLEKAWEFFPHPFRQYYQIGPFVLCLISASESLMEKLTGAFAHLKLYDVVDSADLTLYLWDTEVIHQKLPPLNWNLIHANGYRGFSNPPIYFHFFDAIGALSALHTEKKKGYYIVRSAANLPWWVSGSPLQVILHAWLREMGLQLTHTAAIGNEHAAALLVGQSGSGKSTTTLTCIRGGLHYLGEDYCILKPESSPKVFSIYQSAKWTAHTRALFPEYEDRIINRETANQEKALIYYKDLFPQQIKTSSSIQALVSLKVGTQSSPNLKQYDAGSALKDLMMSTLIQLPFPHLKTMSILKTVVSSVQCYQLILGQNLQENVRLTQGLLR